MTAPLAHNSSNTNAMKNIITLSVAILIYCTANKVCAQNYNQNVNQNTVIINNQPVIEKKEYIIKYRTVYVDKPQPRRIARKLAAPICLLNYLWVYPEDLGTYEDSPDGIISQINRQGQYGRNNWRVPTSDELRLMENYAKKCGLGDGIYLATSHRNGILRLVSTGASIQEQKQQRLIAERQRMEYLQRQNEIKSEMQRNAAIAATNAYKQSVSIQNNLISSGKAILNNGILWATKNEGAGTVYDKGIAYSDVKYTSDWRLPTETEFKNLLSQSVKCSSYYQHPCGLIIPFGVYAVKRIDGSEGYLILPEKMVSNGTIPRFVRFVQNKK